MSHAETPAAAAPPAPSRQRPSDVQRPVGRGGRSSSAMPIGLAIGHRMGSRFDWVGEPSTRTTSRSCSATCSGTFGYLAGLGILNHPVARLFGRPGADLAKGATGWSRYLRASTDHKVIGLQYLMGIGVFFFIGGLNAMLIRVELLRPTTPTFSPGRVSDAGRAARLDDDHDGLEHHPGAVRALLRAPHDRQPADGVPAPRGAVVLAAAAGRRRDPDDDHRLRGLPDRLDRLSDARRPGRRGHGRVHVRLRADRDRDDPERAQHDGDGLQSPRAGADVVAAADLRVEHADHVGADAARPADAARGGADAGARPHGRRRRSSSRPVRRQPRSCGRTCSGSSAIPRCTSSPCRASGSCSRSCRCSRASRCGASGWRSRACWASRCCRSWCGSTTCS